MLFEKRLSLSSLGLCVGSLYITFVSFQFIYYPLFCYAIAFIVTYFMNLSSKKKMTVCLFIPDTFEVSSFSIVLTPVSVKNLPLKAWMLQFNNATQCRLCTLYAAASPLTRIEWSQFAKCLKPKYYLAIMQFRFKICFHWLLCVDVCRQNSLLFLQIVLPCGDQLHKTYDVKGKTKVLSAYS